MSLNTAGKFALAALGMMALAGCVTNPPATPAPPPVVVQTPPAPPAPAPVVITPKPM